MAQIRVGGVYGVGKTTAIDSALEKLSGLSDPNIVKIKGSEIMARILQIHPDLLPEQPTEARHQARAEMYEEISLITNGVRDAHFSVVTDQGDFEFPQSKIDKACVGALIVITARPDIISERRRRSARIHRSTKIEDIIRHQDTEVQAAAELAKQLGIPLYVVDNSESGVESAASKIRRIILKHTGDKN